MRVRPQPNIPKQGKFPTLNFTVDPAFFSSLSSTSGKFVTKAVNRKLKTSAVKESLDAGVFLRSHELVRRDDDELTKRGLAKRDAWKMEGLSKRDLSGRASGTIDPWYGCDLCDEVIDYALKFSVPWSTFSMCGFLVFLLTCDGWLLSSRGPQL